MAERQHPKHGPGEVTRLLHAWQGGDGAAHDELWQVVYDELRGLARHVLRGRGRGAAIQPTSLVNQVYLRLLGSGVDWSDRRHFFAVAARAMRFVLADEARRRMAKKRGEGEAGPLEPVEDQVADPRSRPEEVIAVHQALERLGRVNARHERLVELRYFAGLSVAETAEVLEVTPRTVVRDWRAVRVWLHGELGAPVQKGEEA